MFDVASQLSFIEESRRLDTRLLRSMVAAVLVGDTNDRLIGVTVCIRPVRMQTG